MKKIIFFTFTLFLIGFTYAQSTDNKAKEIKLLQSGNEIFKITNVSFVKDTMIITSLSDFLFYPFGQYSQVGAFITKSKIEWYRSVNKFTFNDTVEMTIYKFWRLDDSFLNFYISIFTESMELISGDITDKEVMLRSNIHTGMTKQDFLNRFFITPARMLTDDINYVKIISGWHDLAHIYTFDNEILKRIQFTTDYNYY